MKKLFLTLIMIASAALTFAQSNDFQALAVIKYNNSDTIFLKDLKTRVKLQLKQAEQMGIKDLSIDDRKKILDEMIAEKLINQAAAKEQFNLPSSQVDAAFLGMFAQNYGRRVTEEEVANDIKKSLGKTMDEYLKENLGMDTKEYKTYLKAQLTARQYVLAKKGQEIQSVTATEDDINKFYELQKSNLKWDDSLKLFLVVVPKREDAAAAKAKIDELHIQYKKDPVKQKTALTVSTDNGKVYAAQEYPITKNPQVISRLGWDAGKVLELFKNKEGWISTVEESERDYRFYSVIKKYNQKFLDLYDPVQPEEKTTVYEYLKETLTAQKQNLRFSQAIAEVINDLDPEKNVTRPAKATGEALDKLLAW